MEGLHASFSLNRSARAGWTLWTELGKSTHEGMTRTPLPPDCRVIDDKVKHLLIEDHHRPLETSTVEEMWNELLARGKVDRSQYDRAFARGGSPASAQKTQQRPKKNAVRPQVSPLRHVSRSPSPDASPDPAPQPLITLQPPTNPYPLPVMPLPDTLPAERLIAPDVPPPLPLPAPLPIADRQRNPKAKFALVLGVIIVATAIIGGRSLTSGATVSATSFSMPSRTDMHNSIALATTHAKLVVLPAFANAAVAASNTTQALAAPALAQLRSWWAAATSSQSSIERELEATKAELAKAQALAASVNLSLAVLPPEKPNHPAGGGRHRSQTRDSAKGDRGGPSVAAVLFTGIIVGAAGRKLFYELARPNQINDPTTQGWVHVDY